MRCSVLSDSGGPGGGKGLEDIVEGMGRRDR